VYFKKKFLNEPENWSFALFVILSNQISEMGALFEGEFGLYVS